MTWFVLSLLTAVCESLKDVFSKRSLEDIDEYVIAWSLQFFSLPFLLHKLKRRAAKQFPMRLQALAPIGFFGALTAIFQMIAISLTLVAYVIAIKRTSAVMSVLWGFLIFKEAGFKERLLGASIMVAGVLWISLF